MKVNVIEKVTEYIRNARSLVPAVTDDMLDTNGAIHYMNGNDGTDFDWGVNDHLCEFMVFGKNEMGFIKVLVEKNDVIRGWIYEDFGMRPTHTLETAKLDEGEARKFACQMFQIADRKQLWDRPITELDFTEEVSSEWDSMLNDEDEEWEDYFDSDADEDDDEEPPF